MTRFRISLCIGAIAFSLMLVVAPAEAQSFVSYVSGSTGSNNNSCNSPTAACVSLETAFNKTEPGGEIKCLDGHVDAFFTINKPITIDCGAPGTLIRSHDDFPAITVNIDEATYPNGVVTLRNLSINGFPGNGIFPTGFDGIRVIGGGGAVHIENSTILGFAQQGIDFEPSSSVDLFVRDTVISNSAGGGILTKPTGSGNTKVVLDNVDVEGNASGILVDGTTMSGNISATVRNSTIANSATFGLRAADSGSGTTNVMIEGSTVSNNSGAGVVAVGSNTTVRMRNSTVTRNERGLNISSAKIISHGGNVVAGNLVADGVFTSTLPQQ